MTNNYLRIDRDIVFLDDTSPQSVALALETARSIQDLKTRIVNDKPVRPRIVAWNDAMILRGRVDGIIGEPQDQDLVS